MTWFGSQAQHNYFERLRPATSLIDSGSFKDYYKFDLGNIEFFNGIGEHNLSYFLRDKSEGKVLFIRPKDLSDAMILKPAFFYNDSAKTYVILVESAAEYSWGQEVILIDKNENAKIIGFLDYAVDRDNGLSISDYAILYYDKNKIVLGFEDLPIIHYPDESVQINGKDLKFQLDFNGIKKIE
jgi:hypothetical protein